jgi:acyl dehydratase
MIKQALYLDDLKVGDTFVSETYPFSTEKIKEFAREFDPQVFHCDEQLAEDTFFKGLAASGWHTASITMKLLTESLPFAHGIIGAGGEINWPQPTRPDDILYVKSTIKEIKPSKSKPNQALLLVESETLNQKNEVCQKLTAKLLSFRKSEE